MSLVRLLWISCLSISLAQAAKVSLDLKNKKPAEKLDVIVQFNSSESDNQQSKIAKHGGKLKVKLNGIKASVVSMLPQAIEALSKDDDVKYISLDRRVTRMLEY